MMRDLKLLYKTDHRWWHTVVESDTSETGRRVKRPAEPSMVGEERRLLGIHLRAWQSPELSSSAGVNGNIDRICTIDGEAAKENQQNIVQTKPDLAHGPAAKHECFWDGMKWSHLA